jgi:CubicO group peptidase (beta-lactamase class C family)
MGKITILLVSLALMFIKVFGVGNKDIFLEVELGKYVEEYVENGLFSGTVLVANGEDIIFCKSYGMANYELNVLNSSKTKFRIASITKQFTAMLIMQLQEKGLLNVNDSISKYISDYPNGHKITIHHLLTHTSGISDFREFPDYYQERSKSRTLEQTIEIFKNKPLEFEPGEVYRYSNSGYILLSYIIEKVSGKTYETILKENILNPLNMKNSGLDHHSLIINDRASGYCCIDNVLINAPYADTSYLSGVCAIYSTVEDLYLWNRVLYTEKLVSKKSLIKIFDAHVITNLTNPGSSGYASYGYGWNVGKLYNRDFVGHGGRTEGFASSIRRCPDGQICIIVLSNFEHSPAKEISQGLAALVFGEIL